MAPHPLIQIREAAPLVLNITNYVVMNNTANALLALGASPVMAHAPEELEEMVGLASALVINIGTLSTPWIAAMLLAGGAARRKGIPVVLDPVGCGATRFRTATARRFLDEIGPGIIRGNASEIDALAGADGRTRGVDSSQRPEEIAEGAVALARRAGCVVSVSGADDLITDGQRLARVSNGHPLMTRVTGMGCTASALTGACAAALGDAFEAALSAMEITGVCGEIAAAQSAGPGSLQSAFLDVLYRLTPAELTAHARVTRTGVES